jgi:hypothetical protein
MIVAVAILLSIGIGLVARGGTRAAVQQPATPTPLIARPALPPTPSRPPAPAPPTAAGTPLLQASFEALAPTDAQGLPTLPPDWTAVDLAPLTGDDAPARWGVEDGLLRQLWTGSLGAPRPAPTAAIGGQADWRDYTLQAEVYATGNMELGLLARYQAGGYYRLRVLNAASPVTPQVRLERVEGTQVTLLAAQEGPGYALHRWYRLRLQVVGPRLEAQLDDGPVLVAEDASLAAGQVGVYGLALGDLAFDNVTVTTQ